MSGPNPWLGPVLPSQFFLAPSRRLGTPSTGASRGWPLFPTGSTSKYSASGGQLFFRAGDRSLGERCVSRTFGGWPFCPTSWRFEMDAPQAGRAYSIGDVINALAVGDSWSGRTCTFNVDLVLFGRNWHVVSSSKATLVYREPRAD